MAGDSNNYRDDWGIKPWRRRRRIQRLYLLFGLGPKCSSRIDSNNRSNSVGPLFIDLATARRARRRSVNRHLSRSRAPFDLLPRSAREKSRAREPVCLCRLVDGIEKAGIERQIGPYCAARVQEQWYNG